MLNLIHYNCIFSSKRLKSTSLFTEYFASVLKLLSFPLLSLNDHRLLYSLSSNCYFPLHDIFGAHFFIKIQYQMFLIIFLHMFCTIISYLCFSPCFYFIFLNLWLYFLSSGKLGHIYLKTLILYYRPIFKYV